MKTKESSGKTGLILRQVGSDFIRVTVLNASPFSVSTNVLGILNSVKYRCKFLCMLYFFLKIRCLSLLKKDNMICFCTWTTPQTDCNVVI